MAASDRGPTAGGQPRSAKKLHGRGWLKRRARHGRTWAQRKALSKRYCRGTK